MPPKKLLAGKRKADDIEAEESTGKRVKDKHSSLNDYRPTYETPYTVNTLPKTIEKKEELPLIGNVAHHIDPDDWKSFAKLIKYIIKSYEKRAVVDRSHLFRVSIGMMKAMAEPMQVGNSDSLGVVHDSLFMRHDLNIKQRDEFLKYVSSQVKKGVPFGSKKMKKLLEGKFNQLRANHRYEEDSTDWWPLQVGGWDEVAAKKGKKKVDTVQELRDLSSQAKVTSNAEKKNHAKKVKGLKEFRAGLPDKLSKGNEDEIVRIAEGIDENDYLRFSDLIRYLKTKKANRSLLSKVVRVGPRAFQLAVQAILIEKLPAKEIVLFMERHQNIPFGSEKMASWLEEKINDERESVPSAGGIWRKEKRAMEEREEKKMAKKGKSAVAKTGAEKKAATEKKGAKPTSRISSKPARAKKPRCEGGHFCGTIISIKKIFKKEGYQSNDEACKMIKEYYRKEGKEMYEQLMGNLLRQMKAQKKKRVTQGMVTAAIESI